MSNQTFSNKTKVFDYIAKEWSSASLKTPITSAGYDTDDFLFDINYTVEGSWGQVGGNVTKNGITFSSGSSVEWNLKKSEKGPSFDINTGSFNIFFDGDYRIEGILILKRIAGMGDRNHFLGISVNGADPIEIVSGFGVSDVIFGQVSISCYATLSKDDKVSLNYAQTEGSDEIFCAPIFSIIELSN